MVVSAKDVKAQIKADAAEVIRVREDAAVAFIEALQAEALLKERVKEAEAETAVAAAVAVKVLGESDAARLTGVPAATLRKLKKAAKAVE